MDMIVGQHDRKAARLYGHIVQVQAIDEYAGHAEMNGRRAIDAASTKQRYLSQIG